MADESVDESPDCIFIENLPYASRSVGSAGWNTPGCCLRATVYRFPPYVDFAGKPLFPDFDSPVLHMCGAIIESVKILASSVGCPCIRKVPTISAALNGSADLRAVADYSYTTPHFIVFQNQDYPLGSLSLGSILGRENLIPPPGIDLIRLYTPGTWAGFISSVIAVTILLDLVCFFIGKLQERHVAVSFWKSLPIYFFDTLGIKWGQSMGWYSKLSPNTLIGYRSYHCHVTARKLFILRALVVGVWSLLSNAILCNVMSSNLLEALLYTHETDRFTSMGNLISRILNEDKVSRDLLVLTFDRSPLFYMLRAGEVSLPHVEILSGAADIASRLVNLIDQLQASSAVLVGVAATLAYIKSTAVNVLDCTECEDYVYIQEDSTTTVPYYIKTSRLWPADKERKWRSTTAVLLESGLSDFAYRRALRKSIPELARQEARDREEHASLLAADELAFDELSAIVNVCFGLCGFACEIFLFELCLTQFFIWFV